MDAYTLAYAIFGSDWIRFIAALIGANVLLGVAAALFNRRVQFYLASMGDWLLSRVIPYVLGWGAVKLVAITAFADMRMVADGMEATVSAFVIAALLGKIGDQLRELGFPIPVWATDKPKIESSVTP